jgi:hypothetical protein
VAGERRGRRSGDIGSHQTRANSHIDIGLVDQVPAAGDVYTGNNYNGMVGGRKNKNKITNNLSGNSGQISLE